MTHDFQLFLSQLSETNTTLQDFTDFKKVSTNVNKIAIKLNQLNYLIGKDNLELAIKELFEENPKVFEVLDILIAVRKSDKKKVINGFLSAQYIDEYFKTETGICEFIRKTGLAEVFRSKEITNLVDYVFGVEVGLDTNARKNRGGHNMENTIAKAFSDANIFFKQEVYNKFFPEIMSLGEDLK